MSWYAHRRQDGSIAIAMANLLPGYALEPQVGELLVELIEDDDQELQTVRNPPPGEVSPLQMRRALRLLGQQQERDIIGQVNAYVAMLPEEDQEAWEYAVAIPIDDPRIVTACMLLQLDREALFRLAGSLT